MMIAPTKEVSELTQKIKKEKDPQRKNDLIKELVRSLEKDRGKYE